MQFGDIFIPLKFYLLAENSDVTGCPVFYQATLLQYHLRYQVKWRTGKRGQCLVSLVTQLLMYVPKEKGYAGLGLSLSVWSSPYWVEFHTKLLQRPTNPGMPLT